MAFRGYFSYHTIAAASRTHEKWEYQDDMNNDKSKVRTRHIWARNGSATATLIATGDVAYLQIYLQM